MTSVPTPKANQRVVQCYHCGNKTLMNAVGLFEWGSKFIDPEESDLSFFDKFELFSCPVCHKPTLIETYGDETMLNAQNDWYDDVTVLYPMSSFDNKAVPKKIAEAFEAALKVKNIDNGVCLMALRRTLELVLCDKGATKWGLKEKIEEIAALGLLPESLKEVSKFAKILGDTAAHGKDDDVDSNDVSTMVEFVKYILEYLYVLPHKIDIYKKKIEKQEKPNDE